MVGARKETQIRNNHFYPEVRKSRLYEIILLSPIIPTKILIWGHTVLEKHCVGKCLSDFSEFILKEKTDFLCIILGEIELPKAIYVPTINTPYAYTGKCSSCHSLLYMLLTEEKLSKRHFTF